MARFDFLNARRFALAGALVCAFVPILARAADLPRLHITSLGQHLDRSSVAPHESFHVSIRVRVTQHVAGFIDELVLGDLENCTITGDERIRTPLPDGTEFTERLTLEARAAGTASISPAHIDAIDPQTGKAARYSSNAVIVRVTGAPEGIDRTYSLFVTALRWLLAIAGVLAALFVAWAIFAIRRKAAAPTKAVMPSFAAPVPTAPSPPLSIDARIALAAQEFRENGDALALADLRAVLFERAGLSAGATLVDALRALGPNDRALRVALIAADRAIFGPQSERQAAGHELLDALQTYLASAARPGGAHV